MPYRSLVAEVSATTEGLWTPSLAGSIVRGNHAYASERLGHWITTGNLCVAFFALTCTKDAAINGNIFIDGLPFPIRQNLVNSSGVALVGFTGFTFPGTGYTQLLMNGVAGTDQMLIRFYGSNLSPITCTQAYLGNVVNVRGSLNYLIN